MSIQQGVDSLNPFQAVFTSSTQVQRLLYDSLTRYKETDTTSGAGLSESWTTSEGGLEWTYRIRSGVKFSDGQPLTARDIAFTYDLLMRDPAARKANGHTVVDFESVSAPDDTTFVVRTKVSTPTMLGLDIPVVPTSGAASRRSPNTATTVFPSSAAARSNSLSTKWTNT